MVVGYREGRIKMILSYNHILYRTVFPLYVIQRRLWKRVLYYDPISGIIIPWLYSRHRRNSFILTQWWRYSWIIVKYVYLTLFVTTRIRNRDNWMPWLYSIQGIRGVPYPIYSIQGIRGVPYLIYQSSFIIYFHIYKSSYVLSTQQRSWKRVLYYYVSLTVCFSSKE